jgi:excisionase family DNA binding protein
MAATVLSNGTVLIEDDVREEASSVIHEAHDRSLAGLTITLEDGDTVSLPPRLSAFLASTIERISQGGAVTMTTLPEVLTTTTAADVLGVSRPTLMKIIASGELPATKVRSHTRVTSADVLALRHRRFDTRAANFEALLHAEEALD